MPSLPSDICLTLAAVTETDWLSAAEINDRLKRLGFKDLTAQWVSAGLRRLTRIDAPPVETRVGPWGGGSLEFRTTNWGRTWLANNVRWAREWR